MFDYLQRPPRPCELIPVRGVYEHGQFVLLREVQLRLDRLFLLGRHRVEPDLPYRHDPVLGQVAGQDLEDLFPEPVVVGLLGVEADGAVVADAELAGPEALPAEKAVEVIDERVHRGSGLSEPERGLHDGPYARGGHRLVVVGGARGHMNVWIKDSHLGSLRLDCGPAPARRPAAARPRGDPIRR